MRGVLFTVPGRYSLSVGQVTGVRNVNRNPVAEVRRPVVGGAFNKWVGRDCAKSTCLSVD